MQCTFCATGRGGFFRNLESNEIVSQVLQVEEEFQERRASNVVFMGEIEQPMAGCIALCSVNILAAARGKCRNGRAHGESERGHPLLSDHEQRFENRR